MNNHERLIYVCIFVACVIIKKTIKLTLSACTIRHLIKLSTVAKSVFYFMPVWCLEGELPQKQVNNCKSDLVSKFELSQAGVLEIWKGRGLLFGFLFVERKEIVEVT